MMEPVGPFTADQLVPGARYELVQGHPVYQAATGGDGATTIAVGATALGSDPQADGVGIDAGYVLNNKNVRAPDIAVGNVPDARGFISGAPLLAVEYAGEHQDEVKLQEKIVEFLDLGTRLIWVVRIIGPRRVEIYEKDKPVTLAGPGQLLSAPGILSAPLPVEALFDRSASNRVALKNLLLQQGYGSVDEIREEGRQEERAGLCRSLRNNILLLLERRGLDSTAQLRSWLDGVTDPSKLAWVMATAGTCGRVEDLYAIETPR
ncbi:MAG: Uma2 family endonuclease [Deltaproteobacteria bacterium]|nr:Uma2 family endonuclease [Deltaproteobacteria bacterium]